MTFDFDVLYLGRPMRSAHTSRQIEREMGALLGENRKVAIVDMHRHAAKKTRRSAEWWPVASSACSAHLLMVLEPQILLTKGYRGKVRPYRVLLRHARGVSKRSELAAIETRAKTLFGSRVEWAPSDDDERQHLLDHAGLLPLSNDNWPPFIEPEAGLFTTCVSRDSPLKIKGVGVPSAERTPPDQIAQRLKLLYPADDRYSVYLPPLDRQVRDQLGEVPHNWHVMSTDGAAPKEHHFDILIGPFYENPRQIVDERVLSALASGALPLLPPSMAPIFGDAAYYCRPREVQPLLRRFDSNLNELEDKWRRALAAAIELFRESDFVARVDALLGQHDTTRSSRSEESNEGDTSIRSFDVTIIGDFTTRDDVAWRIVNEVRTQARFGLSTALIHVGDTRSSSIHPAIDRCLRDGLASALPVEECWLMTNLLQISTPRYSFKAMPRHWPHIRHRVCIVVEDGGPQLDYDPATQHKLFSGLFGSGILWAATRESTRLELAKSVPISAEIWHPVSSSDERPNRHNLNRRGSVVGTVALGTSQALDNLQNLCAAVASSDIVVQVLDGFRISWDDRQSFAPNINFLDLELDIDRFVSGLDYLAYYPTTSEGPVPITLIATALMWGIPVLLPPDLRSDAGEGPIYCPADKLPEKLSQLRKNTPALRRAISEATRAARPRFSPDQFVERIARIAPKTFGHVTLEHPQNNKQRRILFVTANGVGLGHLVRTSAIARRLPDGLEPVFATMSQALPVLESMGYAAEFLTTYSGHSVDDWQIWTQRRLHEILDYHRPSVVVLDATNPYSGVLRAVLSRKNCRLVWLRRGMWRPAQRHEEFLVRAPYFDLIVEPEDIAQSYDRGATADNKDAVLSVPPIRLLDEDDLLDGAVARRELNIAPDRIAVLVQLGSDTTRDVYKILDRVFASLSKFPEIEIVNTQWLNARSTLNFWPKIKQISGFPISRYFRAFDFTISGAGYNSFNEIISFGVPAIFIANESPVMDDQRARARFAEDHAAAFDLGEANISDLPRYVSALCDSKTRAVLSVNAKRIARENGAVGAAQAIADLVNY